MASAEDDWLVAAMKEADGEVARLRAQDDNLYGELSEGIMGVVNAAEAVVRNSGIKVAAKDEKMFASAKESNSVKLHDVNSYVQVALQYQLGKLVSTSSRAVVGDGADEDVDLLGQVEDHMRNGQTFDALGIFLAFNVAIDRKKLSAMNVQKGNQGGSSEGATSPVPSPSPHDERFNAYGSSITNNRLTRITTSMFKVCFENLLLCLIKNHKPRFVETSVKDVNPTDAELAYVLALWQLAPSAKEAWRAVKFCFKKNVTQGLPPHKAGLIGYQSTEETKKRDWTQWRVNPETRKVTKGDLKRGKIPAKEEVEPEDVRTWCDYIVRLAGFHQRLLRCIPEPPPHTTITELYASTVREVTEECLSSMLTRTNALGKPMPVNPTKVAELYRTMSTIIGRITDATHSHEKITTFTLKHVGGSLPNHYVEGLSQFTAYIMSPFVKAARDICVNNVEYVKAWYAYHVEEDPSAPNPELDPHENNDNSKKAQKANMMLRMRQSAPPKAVSARDFMPLADFKSLDQSRMLPTQTPSVGKATAEALANEGVRLRDSPIDSALSVEYELIPPLSDKELEATDGGAFDYGFINRPKRVTMRVMKVIRMVDIHARTMHHLPAASAASLALACLRALEKEVLNVDGMLRGNATLGIRLKKAMLGLSSAPALQRGICALILEIQVLDGRTADGSWLRLSSEGAVQEVEALLARAAALQCRLELTRQGGLHRLVESGLNILRRGTAYSESYEWTSTKHAVDLNYPGAHIRLYRLSLNSLLMQMLGTLSSRVTSTAFTEMFQRSWRSLCAYYLSISPSVLRRKRYLSDVAFLTGTLLAYLPVYAPSEEANKLLPNLSRDLSLITRGICMRAGLLCAPIDDLYKLWDEKVPSDVKGQENKVDHLTAIEDEVDASQSDEELWSWIPDEFIERQRAPPFTVDLENYNVLNVEHGLPSMDIYDKMKTDRLRYISQSMDTVYIDTWKKWQKMLLESVKQHASSSEIAVVVAMRRDEMSQVTTGLYVGAEVVAASPDTAASTNRHSNEKSPTRDLPHELPSLTDTRAQQHRAMAEAARSPPHSPEQPSQPPPEQPSQPPPEQPSEATSPQAAPPVAERSAERFVLPPMHPEDL